MEVSWSLLFYTKVVTKQTLDTLAMAGWYLSELRMKNIREDKRPQIDPKDMFKIRPPKKVTSF